MKKIALLDTYNLMYRFFYAVPPLTRIDGTPTNALFGFAKFLTAFIQKETPDGIIATMDSPGATLREQKFQDYKAQRDRMPDDLRSQIPHIEGLLQTFDIPILAIEGYEADDIMGTLARRYAGEGAEVFIVSGDKDLCQMVDDHIRIYDGGKRMILGQQEVVEKFGVLPSQVIDYLAIVGDASDNIPGIQGFGPKKAVELLSKYGSLDGIYTHLSELSGKTLETLQTHREVAFLSRELATITCDVPIILADIPQITPETLHSPAVVACFQKYGFTSLMPKSLSPVPTLAAIPASQTKEIVSVSVPSEFARLKHEISHSKNITVVTEGDKFMLTRLLIAFGDTVSEIDLASRETGEFISEILQYDGILTGFDLKTDLIRLQSYVTQRDSASQSQLF